MNSTELPFSSSDASDFARITRITLAEMSNDVQELADLRSSYTLADYKQREMKRDAILVLIREKLKDIRTRMMDYETAYHALMSKVNEL